MEPIELARRNALACVQLIRIVAAWESIACILKNYTSRQDASRLDQEVSDFSNAIQNASTIEEIAAILPEVWKTLDAEDAEEWGALTHAMFPGWGRPPVVESRTGA